MVGNGHLCLVEQTGSSAHEGVRDRVVLAQGGVEGEDLLLDGIDRAVQGHHSMTGNLTRPAQAACGIRTVQWSSGGEECKESLGELKAIR